MNKLIALNFQKFSKIVNHIEEIDAAIVNSEAVNFDIGGNWTLSLSSAMNCIYIRKWFKTYQDDNLYPTTIEMYIHFTEWNLFKQCVKTIHLSRPDIAAVVPCYNCIDCVECNPPADEWYPNIDNMNC
jgi:hypothetical protein